jgi:hypothetical protein
MKKDTVKIKASKVLLDASQFVINRRSRISRNKGVLKLRSTGVE